MTHTDFPFDEFDEEQRAPAIDVETLRALGFDIDAMRDEVVQSAILRLTEYAMRDMRKKIVAEAQEQVNKAVATHVNQLVDEVLLHKYTPVDQWGEPTGEETSVKAILARQLENFYSQKVDFEGRPTSSYSGVPRHEYLVKKTVEELLKQEGRNTINEIAKQVKQALNGEIREAFGRVMDDVLSGKRR